MCNKVWAGPVFQFLHMYCQIVRRIDHYREVDCYMTQLLSGDRFLRAGMPAIESAQQL